MGQITNPSTIAGSGLDDPIRNAGAPSNGTDEVWTLTIGGSPTNGDTFRLTGGGFETANIAWNSTNATLVANVDAALEALPTIGTGGVVTAAGTITLGIGTITVTYSGGNLTKLALQANFNTVSNNSLTGAGTVAIAQTTPGVTATGRPSVTGALCIDTTNAILYQNTGTALAPTWSKVGLET